MVSDEEVVKYAHERGYLVYDFEALRFALMTMNDFKNGDG